jgi:hypothetical protein
MKNVKAQVYRKVDIKAWNKVWKVYAKIHTKVDDKVYSKVDDKIWRKVEGKIDVLFGISAI